MKQKTTDPKKRIGSGVKGALYIGGVIVTVLLLAVGISFYQNNGRLNNYANVLEGVYRSAYFNMVDKVNAISVDTDKLLAAQTPEAQRTALLNISKDCQSIVTNLSVLSIETENVVNATKFFNQFGGMCDAYVVQLFARSVLSDEQMKVIEDASKTIVKLKDGFNVHNEGITAGEYAFVNSNMIKDGKSEFGSSMSSLKADNMEYPAMIFDGPFSASLETKQIKGLSSKTVTKESAKEYVMAKVFKDKKAKIVSENTTKGEFDTYDFGVKAGGLQYYVQITVRDGFPLTISTCALESVAKYGEDDAIKNAETFAKELGIRDMQCVWSEKVNQIVYVNLAPVVNDVIMYPDLIKVKVDLSSGEVIGWEARSYAFNHTERNINPTILEDEALCKVEPKTRSMRTRLAIIPLDKGGETLTYEVVSDRADGMYYTYIDAHTAEVIKTLKEITTDKMHKLM